MLAAITFIAALFAQSCTEISGDGTVVSQKRDLSGFTAIDANISADVYFTQDNFYKVEIQAEPDIQDLIETRVDHGTLVVEVEKYKTLRNHERIVVNITAPNLTGLAMNGSGSINTQRPVNTKHLDVDVNGSGSIKMAGLTGTSLSAEISGSGSIVINGGTVDKETTHISGSGSINIIALSAKTASTETSGSGKTSVWASDDLDVHISGSGDVYYKGNPAVHSQTSGSGRIAHR